MFWRYNYDMVTIVNNTGENVQKKKFLEKRNNNNAIVYKRKNLF